jgi:hypothetical protein
LPDGALYADWLISESSQPWRCRAVPIYDFWRRHRETGNFYFVLAQSLHKRDDPTGRGFRRARAHESNRPHQGK